MIQSRIKNYTVIWSANLRPRVNSVVVHNDKYYQNVTGINSEPSQNSNDWLFIGNKESSDLGNLKIASKGVGNTSSGAEPNDIIFGMLDDGVTFIPFGKWLGPVNEGGLQNVDNYITNPIEF